MDRCARPGDDRQATVRVERAPRSEKSSTIADLRDTPGPGLDRSSWTTETVRAADPPSLELLRRAARGDDAALTRLYEEHVDGLHAFVLLRVGRDRDLAEDVVQETFLRALGRWADYDPGRGSLRIWLCWLSRNAIRDHLKRHRRGAALAEAAAAVDATMAQIFQALDHAPLCDELLARAETRSLVGAVIEGLPPGYGEVLRRKYVLGDSLEAIAAALSITEEATKSRLARARRAFRAAFDALAALGDAPHYAPIARDPREVADA